MKLIDKIKLDDEAAFNEIFELYHRKLYYFILNKTKSEFCAEETVQLAFIKLWRYRHSLNSELPLESQLYRIAKTILIDQLRAASSFDRVLLELKETSTAVDFNHGPAQLFEQDLTQQLQTALSSMSPIRKKVFESSRFHGLSYRQIAEELSISIKTVENHINLALKHVKKHIVSLFILMIWVFQ